MSSKPTVEIPPTVKRPVCFRPTKCQKGDSCYLSRHKEHPGTHHKRDFRNPKYMMSIPEAIKEGQRCLKCIDPPCQASCPTQLDVRTFTNAMGEGNMYAAAKTLFTHNPLAWTCGLLCPTCQACRGSCTLTDTVQGPIHINEMHQVACDAFMHMKIPQIRDPSIVEQPYHKAKIAMIGAGPASLSCATFLARIGYQDITIFEKQSYPGGTPAIEIPEFRIPYHVTRFEVKLVEDLGVKIVYNKTYGKDFTIDSLKQDGYQAIFMGIGFPEAHMVDPFMRHKDLPNVWNSKSFLNAVALASKPGMIEGKVPELPHLPGHVVVCGAGDVAADCCQAAFRCGADFVSLVFRRGSIDMRMNEDEAEHLRVEKVEMVPCHSPTELVIEDGKATGLMCNIMKKIPGTDKYVHDQGQTRVIKFDHVISAFGSLIGTHADPIYEKLVPGRKIEVNEETMASNTEGVFAGGDCVGSGTIVEAVNDGKVAAWGIHRYLAKLISNVEVPAQPTEVPPFMTPVDLVDLSVNIAGMKFPNPFGIASGPSSENCNMLKRAYQAGFGWVVTKTFQPDEDMLENVSPRIVGDAESNTYLNIELNSERTAAYWEKELPKLKKEFPDRILLASIHSKGDLNSWVNLAKRIAATGVDGLQLNISCPNLGEKDSKPFTEVIRETVAAVHAAVPLPLFPKIGHFQGSIVELAKAAKEGGASGVSGVNTISGLWNVTADGKFVPEVGFGPEARTAYGGMSGRAIKPFALSGVAEVCQSVPNFPFLACGGIENALTAWEFIQCGAPAVQFCSASMHKGFKTLIGELIPGLKFLLYARSRDDLKTWKSFVPPAVLAERSHRKRFGLYYDQDEDKEIESLADAKLPAEPIKLKEFVLDQMNGASSSTTPSSIAPEIKTIESEVGTVLNKLVHFNELKPQIKVVSTIDVDRCWNCGRCQTACFDAGYACIIFDRTSRIPKVTPMCHGCGLCAAVCPAKCISMKPKEAKK
ncbi:dihydropyrimidine dehydrogenase (NAD+) [Monocercomonoides exilis]|uniref:dihydropyrimidine dehydrogenase (NAD+) n=1 Tax=Monocercomonoides exilis TaxID=2049356 RepID=UPI00355A68DC|nr:dihydropyrimidine dehydrogenase (NAD+) [Monocercomonoides exilis]|eukprot:MONOS_248.1-p1 / transcript=MONOS_248.1 / gene=MONOS_248 / organism=Monocercomonoides_exilis_PA203 / gene_product=dihydropyrimidine dehydrogenase (NAD+) [EC:1.3.1.1] / transcript_product=dihydropyrimidine dehydrogenase (NAD+) [EC:1.3.1.1] / location=Mono_scaffold00004:119276-122279(-) / protein_length=983 / sequence_SO=supercontig / SO=protein_coding / is_pseudo=false